MKRLIYLLTLLYCFTGCKKQEVTQMIAVTRISFNDDTKLQANPLIRFSNKQYEVGVPIPTGYGDNRFEIYDNTTGQKIIDTVLNITGPQEFYIYQPFDIVTPVIVSALPTTPPIDPRNPLKNETPAPDGYVKIKVAFNSQYVVPNQSAVMLVFSVTATSPTIPVVIDTLRSVSSDYNATLFQFKRPVLADGSLSQNFTFGIIDPGTGMAFLNGAGTMFNGGNITLPVGKNNLYMFNMIDAAAGSRSASVGISLNGSIYIVKSAVDWSIE